MTILIDGANLQLLKTRMGLVLDIEKGKKMQRLIDAVGLIVQIPYEEINARMVIANAPTVDAVPVVRCEDCEFSSKPDWDSDEVYCTKHNNWFKINGYCHLGRKSKN